jgi:tricorn protease
MTRCLGAFGALLSLALASFAQETTNRIDARMMRHPDVSATQIAFVYAGDIWLAPKAGGQATRLSSPRGEEAFPKFSPDGRQLAFTASYDGNRDIYTVPVAGGLPHRVTYHGDYDRVVGWYPDGTNLLFASSRTAPKDRFSQLFKVPAIGGLPERLPIPYGEFGAMSPDGRSLAYTPISVDFRTWKRYRGGMNPDIWLFDLDKLTARNITHHIAADSIPMWRGDRIYFISDRDKAQRANLWVWDSRKDEVRQLTQFVQQDVQFPSLGPADIIFENAGNLFLFDLQTEKYRQVDISVVTDRATLKPQVENVSGLIQTWTVSPGGKRALFEARGDIFSVPAQQGVTRNLTRSSGVAERYPAWSPDGKHIAYFSDRTGEYELTLRPAEGNGPEETLTRLGPGYRYPPAWSPDSRKLAFIDQAMRIHLFDRDAATNRIIGRQLWMYHGALTAFTPGWSRDSRWLAWHQELESRNSAIVIHDCASNTTHQVTSGFYDDQQPHFDPDGKHLYFLTGRSFNPIYSDIDNSWIYANTTQIALVPLKADTASPFAPKNDEDEKPKSDKKDEDKKPDDARGSSTNLLASANTNTPAATNLIATNLVADAAATNSVSGTNSVAAKDSKDEKPKPVEIDFADIERRVVLMPVAAGNYNNLIPLKDGKILYIRRPRTGADGGSPTLHLYEFDKKEEKTVLTSCDGAELTADGKKLMVRSGTTYAVVEPAAGQNTSKPVPTGGLESIIDPRAEWQQIFDDTWRLQRDLFYDPGLHGVDWPAMRERYGRMLRDSVTRWDVNYVLGELIGELNSSHTYRSGGDTERPPNRGVGYLGCDFVLTNGAFQISGILDGAPWDTEARSPLRQPGIKVQVGEFLLAVNGTPLDPTREPWAAFQGLANQPALLSVSTNATLEGSREVLVQCLDGEYRLRNLAWIDANRRRVDELSAGRLGYVYVPDTGQNGQNELVRMWRAQITRPGLVIDERFNSGGQIPDRFVELLNRPLRNFWGVRDGRDWPWPPATHAGPKAMLVNGWSGSGGDCLPFYFKQSGLGPLIGTRTWGGLIGITGAPALVDGGAITVPTFGIFSLRGEWIIESEGVSPDIEVVDDPGEMARGGDPQLERAVRELLQQLDKNPPKPPTKPAYPRRSGV